MVHAYALMDMSAICVRINYAMQNVKNMASVTMVHVYVIQVMEVKIAK